MAAAGMSSVRIMLVPWLEPAVPAGLAFEGTRQSRFQTAKSLRSIDLAAGDPQISSIHGVAFMISTGAC